MISNIRGISGEIRDPAISVYIYREREHGLPCHHSFIKSAVYICEQPDTSSP